VTHTLASDEQPHTLASDEQRHTLDLDEQPHTLASGEQHYTLALDEQPHTLAQAEVEPHVLASITALKSRLGDFIEPDFGLLDRLLSLQVLTPRQLADVRSERTVYRRNDALLDLLTSENQCGKFLKALQRTGQQHVVNFITQNGGQRTRFLTARYESVSIIMLIRLSFGPLSATLTSIHCIKVIEMVKRVIESFSHHSFFTQSNEVGHLICTREINVAHFV